MSNAHDVAKYVIYKYWQNGSIITNLKLQKILYYIQGYSFKKCNEAAYREKIYRWPYGPVVPDVYFEYNQFGAAPISEPENEEILGVLSRLKRDKALLSVIDQVIKVSYNYSAAALVDKTHQESPWVKTCDSEIIDPALIATFFHGHDPLEIEGEIL